MKIHNMVTKMDKSPFAYENYKQYLEDCISSALRAGHGLRQRMSLAMHIQPTYLSQVLKGDRDLNADQTIPLAEFLLLLFQRQRAGSVKVRQYFSKQIAEKREAYLQVKNRVKINTGLSDEDKAIYYSDALYGAVHMAVTIPELRTIAKLAERFQQPEEKIHEVTTFLADIGLIDRQGERLMPSNTLLFVDKSSPHVVNHHRNWRIKAMEHAAARKTDDYQITLGVTLSKNDAQLIRQRLAKMIEELAEQIKDSPSEKIMGFCLDFFEY